MDRKSSGSVEQTFPHYVMPNNIPHSLGAQKTCNESFVWIQIHIFSTYYLTRYTIPTALIAYRRSVP